MAINIQDVSENTPSNATGLLALDDESWQNLVNFFDLLLQVDRRVNPHLYQKK